MARPPLIGIGCVDATCASPSELPSPPKLPDSGPGPARRCSRPGCQRELPPDRNDAYCKECRRKWAEEWRRKNPERVQANRRKHVEKVRSTPRSADEIEHERTMKREAEARRRKNKPEAVRAIKLRYLERVRFGQLPPESVERSKARQKARAKAFSERQKALPPDGVAKVREANRLKSRRFRDKDVAKSNAAARRSYERTKGMPKTKEQLASRRRNKLKWRARMRSTPEGREYLNSLTSKWRAKNKEKVATWDAVCKARRAGASGSHTHEEWLACLSHFDGRCYYCGERLTAGTRTRDHLIPIVKGGTNDISNIVPACRSCNCRKNSRTPDEYFADFGVSPAALRRRLSGPDSQH